MAAHFLKAIGVQGVKLHYMSRKSESRAAYRQALIDCETLSKDQRRLEENPSPCLGLPGEKKTEWQ